MRLVLVVLSFVLNACSFVRPTMSPIAVHFHSHSGGGEAMELAHLNTPRARECLIVLLPGIGDGRDSFRANGFVEEAEGHGCDLALVDATFNYYLAQDAAHRVAADVLFEARRQGYRSIWLAGISLGGYGAVLTAGAYPELVDGVILIAPMLGLPPRLDGVVDEVVAAGGLCSWRGEVTAYRHDFQEPALVWAWLREQLHSPDRHSLMLAYGLDDSHAPRHSVLADAMQEHAVVTAGGGHDWSTWRQLWRDVLQRRPWTAPRDVGSSCEIPS